MLSKEELLRYNRHLILPGFGKEAQEKLKASKILVIGAGGLSCPALLYLCAAGVGHIGIIDHDTVDVSNLQRQILFDTADIGKHKAAVAAEKLSKQNPHISFTSYLERLNNDNALAFIQQYDLVLDGCDNFATRYLVNDACVILNKPLVFGSIFKFEGQVSVFNYTDAKGQRGPTYRCLFPEPPQQGEVPNCSEIGVLGVLPGIIGSMQANEAIKIMAGIGEPLSGKLFIMDALSMQTSLIAFEAKPENYSIQKLSDYEIFCGTPNNATLSISGEAITALELKKILDSGKEIFLLDVREPHEYEICHLPSSVLIPMKNIPEQIEKIPEDKQVVVYCHHGMRSAMVIDFLKNNFQYTNLINLTGGIDAWGKEWGGIRY